MLAEYCIADKRNSKALFPSVLHYYILFFFLRSLPRKLMDSMSEDHEMGLAMVPRAAPRRGEEVAWVRLPEWTPEYAFAPRQWPRYGEECCECCRCWECYCCRCQCRECLALEGFGISGIGPRRDTPPMCPRVEYGYRRGYGYSYRYGYGGRAVVGRRARWQGAGAVPAYSGFLRAGRSAPVLVATG